MKNSLIAALLFCAIASCKKEKKEPLTFQETNVIENADSINGQFRLTTMYDMNSDTLVFSRRIISASFYPQKSKANDTIFVSSVSVGNVQLNNIQLKESEPSAFYTDTTNTSFGTLHHWIIQGSGNIAGFSIVNVPVFPIYSNITLPDTIFIGQQQVFNLKFYQATYASVRIIGNNGYIMKTVDSQTRSITFTTNELSTLMGTPIATVYLSFSKEICKTMNGKVYRFKIIDFIMKECVVIP